jgi:hypothetical protein
MSWNATSSRTLATSRLISAETFRWLIAASFVDDHPQRRWSAHSVTFTVCPATRPAAEPKVTRRPGRSMGGEHVLPAIAYE